MRANPLEDLEALLDQFDQDLAVSTGTGAAVDLVETDEEYLAVIDVPGYETSDLEVTYADGRLTVSGTRSDVIDAADDQYIRRERRSTSVEKTVALPGPVVEEDITATHDTGVLTVTLPKADPEADGHAIDIE